MIIPGVPTAELGERAVARDEHAANVLRLRRLAVIALVAWPAFGLVDWFVVNYVHPGRLWVYLSLRAVGLLILAGIAARIFSRPMPSPRLLRVLEMVGFTSVVALVSASCVEFRGIASPLALGVFTVLVARAAVLADHWKRALLPIGLATAAYPAVLIGLALAVPAVGRQFSDPGMVGQFVLNLLFVTGAAALMVAGGHAIWSLRRQVYRARSLGRYRLERRIDKGGMGEVWLAHHRTLKRDVAVKILRPDKHTEEQAVVRFEREVQATAELTHPNTVRVYDYGVTVEGLCYYAMELLEGEHLGEKLRRVGALDPARAVELMLQASRAMAEAHDRGIIHRDIKPANLFIIRIDGAREFVKVLDFGLAKCRAVDPGPAITQEDFVMGTPHFMSPEILQGKGADKPSDVYALGGVLYQALCGAPPFDYPDTHRVLLAHLNEPVEHIQDRLPVAIPEPLADVIMRCLDKDPDRRYGSAGELADALEECLEHISGSSRPAVAKGSVAVPTGPTRSKAAENPELHMSNVLHAPTEKLSREDAVPAKEDTESKITE